MTWGYKTGGRTKGTKNRRTVEREARTAEAAATATASLTPDQIAAMTPLDVMRLGMRQYLLAGDFDNAGRCATDLMPYEHPKLRTVMVDANLQSDPAQLTDGEVAAVIHQLRRKVGRFR